MIAAWRKSRLKWFAENTIALRIGSLSAALLMALVVSTLVMIWDFWSNQNRIETANDRFRRLQIAANADRDFGSLRYWMTDLSVSLLTLSERNAQAAKVLLDADLNKLAEFAPDVAQKIRTSTEDYLAAAEQAADAYTDDNRVIGNTYSAQARVSSDAVVAALNELVKSLSAEAERSNDAARQAAQTSMIRAMVAGVLILVVGAALTWLVLRSIVSPLGKINRAIDQLSDPIESVELPPEGQDEIGRMSSTIRKLHESQKERRILEAAAEAQRSTILTAIETIPDGFALFDSGDRLVLTNERYRTMFAKIADKLVPGMPFEEILRAQVEREPDAAGGQSAEQWIAKWKSHHEHPAGTRQTARINGAWVQVSKSKTPAGGTVAVYSDISDLIEKQAQLEEARQGAESANEAKSRFLASMSHELRTPLNAIIGYSEMLIEGAREAGEDAQVGDLEKIQASGQNLLSLINDILDLSKIEAGKMEVHIERLAVKPLIADIAATIAPLVSKNGNRLVTTVDSAPGEIETDRTKLRQNLFNLLSNAAKFTKQGTIELTVRGEADTIIFSVRDDGIGMTEAQKANMFKAFVQADSSTTRNYGGTGLGLAIVKQFTSMLHGEISVETAPGKGSTFTLRLPIRFESSATDASEEAEDVSSGCVLVIDDDPQARHNMSELLRSEGYRVLIAADGQSGVALANQHRPDAIVLDIIMPERDGWSVMRELKGDPVLCEIPIILATVVSDREMGLAFGAVDHLTKPIDPKVLIATLNELAVVGHREVLIVDDDSATRALFRRYLVREGWAVVEASDGERALAYLDGKRPSLLILDLMMPSLNGFETLRAIRARPDCADLPVIIATSKDLSRTELDWLRSNARDVVIKGRDGRKELLAAIRRHIAT